MIMCVQDYVQYIIMKFNYRNSKLIRHLDIFKSVEHNSGKPYSELAEKLDPSIIE